MANADITASRTGCSVNRDYVSGKLLWKKGLLSDIMKSQVLVLARQGIVDTFFIRLDTLKTIILFERNVSVIVSGSKILAVAIAAIATRSGQSYRKLKTMKQIA